MQRILAILSTFVFAMVVGGLASISHVRKWLADRIRRRQPGGPSVTALDGERLRWQCRGPGEPVGAGDRHDAAGAE